jgi:hypothetical protein
LWPAGAGRALRIEYTSTSWNGRPTVVSGTVALPEGHPSADGWPVVGFGPGYNGSPDSCAMSRVGPPPFAAPLSEALLVAGYAVAFPDFEGIGTPGESSVVDGASEAYALIDAVRAAGRIAPLSRSWASAGYSLGGHAALFAGSLAASYAPELRHVGTIAIAPTTQWALQFTATADPAAGVSPFLPYEGRSLAVTNPERFRAEDWFTPLGLEFVDLAGEVCVEQMAAAVAGLTNADLLLDPAAAAVEFTALFADDEIPTTGYDRPVRLAHGTADALPAALTELTADQLAAAGVDVKYVPVVDADHFSVLGAIAPQTVAWLAELFASA